MRWKWLLAPALTALLSGGCSHPLHQQTENVQVVVEGGGSFPHDLAGRWTARQHGWEFQIEPDGRLAWAVLSLGRVRVISGRTTTVPTKSGGQAVFKPGLWTVHYLPNTGELTVRIVMEHVRVEMGGDILEGSSTDVFVGPVTTGGHIWQTEWTTFTKYAAHGSDDTAFDLSTDPTQGETISLTFEKQ